MRTSVTPPRILYVGNLTPGGTCAQRLRALEDLGCALTPVNIVDPAMRRRDRSLYERVRRRLLGPRDWTGANQQIVSAAQRDRFDVLWVDRGLTIEATTLRQVRDLQPQCRIVGYSPDDMYARHNQSPQFRRHLSLYDIYFTTKSYGVAELPLLGCPATAFSGNAYDPHTHRPMAVSAADRERVGGGVGFVGSWEAARAESMLHLARAGIDVRVWGNMWERQQARHPKLRIEGRALYGNDYGLAINAFDINLSRELLMVDDFRSGWSFFQDNKHALFWNNLLQRSGRFDEEALGPGLWFDTGGDRDQMMLYNVPPPLSLIGQYRTVIWIVHGDGWCGKTGFFQAAVTSSTVTSRGSP